MEDLLLQYGTLVGVSALIAFLINFLKSLGVIQDGQAQNWSAGLNLVALTGLLLLRVFAPDVDVSGLDAQIAQFVDVAIVVVGYLLQLLGSKTTHAIVKGTFLIGKSYSA